MIPNLFSLRGQACQALLVFGLIGGCAIAAAAAEETVGLKFSKRCLMVNPNEGCAVADVNKDGVLDIIAGTHWYAGPDYVPRPLRHIQEVLVEFYNQNGDHPYDVDGDGWIDVISIGWLDPELCWYRNPGPEKLAKGLQWEKHVLKTTRGENECLALKDFDGDGVPEIFVSCWDKRAPAVAWKLAKDDKGQPTVNQIVLGNQGGGHGFAFGDLNGDGREDVVCEVGWYERPAGNPFAGPWKFHRFIKSGQETELPHPSCPCVVVDLNGDGRNDIILAKAHDYGIFWWEQGEPRPDGALTWNEHLIDDSWSQAHALVWADLDGDGRGELIAGKRVRAHVDGDPGGAEPACLYYYTWDKAALKFTRHPISPPGEGVGGGMQIRVADLNGDRRPDVVVAGKSGTCVLMNEGPAK